jgi:hypothetical protein
MLEEFRLELELERRRVWCGNISTTALGRIVSCFESGDFSGVSSFLLCCPPHDSLQCLLLPLRILWVEDMAWWR